MVDFGSRPYDQTKKIRFKARHVEILIWKFFLGWILILSLLSFDTQADPNIRFVNIPAHGIAF